MRELRSEVGEEERKSVRWRFLSLVLCGVWALSVQFTRKEQGSGRQREVASRRAGVAGVVEREALLELLSFGLAETLPLPLPAPPAILLWPTRDRGPGGVLSEWVGGALDDAEEEVPRGTLLPPGSP